MKFILKKELCEANQFEADYYIWVYSIVMVEKRENNFIQEMLGDKETIVLHLGAKKPTEKEFNSIVKKYKREITLKNILD